MSYPFGDTVTVTPMISGRHGERTPGESRTVEGVVIWPTSTNEVVGTQDTVTQGLTAMFPADDPIAATDQVMRDELVYEVDGEPQPWRSAITGRKPGVEVRLKRVTG